MKANTEVIQTSQKTAAVNRGSRNLKKRAVSPGLVKLAAPDLTQRAPRSPRCRLGGYSILPRALDKGRATLAGTNGEYHFNCPVDQRFLSFVGIDAKKLLAELKKGKGDGEVLQWIQATAKQKRSPWEIEQWSDYMDRRGPDSDAETMEFFAGYVAKYTRTREDIKTWADILELDDFVSFGGTA
jgi:Domain of unknown function (DUF5069)